MILGNSLARFLIAQSGQFGPSYTQALHELKSGKKESCWIWYIFPQLKGIGKSQKSEFYGIHNLREARVYLQEVTLGPRLIDAINALQTQLETPGQTLQGVMGGEDGVKVISCLTLFEAAGLQEASSLLKKVGGKCNLTENLLILK